MQFRRFIALLGFGIPLVLLSRVRGFPQQISPNLSVVDPSKTFLVKCLEGGRPASVVSPVSLSHDGKWRAWVEVQSDQGCLLTSRLWVGRADSSYRLRYLMPPRRDAEGNGMEILGWSMNSRMLLVKTLEWQGGDTPPVSQRVLAVDAETGVVDELEPEQMLNARKGKQCLFLVLDAGFGTERNTHILIRARFMTAHDPDETEEDVPVAKVAGPPRKPGASTWIRED